MSVSIGDVIAIADLLHKTISRIKHLWEQNKKNKLILDELQKFVNVIETYINVLQSKNKPEAMSDCSITALSRLKYEVVEATKNVENLFLNKDTSNLKAKLHADKVKQEMDDIRNKIKECFNNTILFIIADVTIDSRNEIIGELKEQRTQFQLSIDEFASNHDKREELISLKKRMEEQDTDNEKFFMEVLNAVDKETVKRSPGTTTPFAKWHEDPISLDTMCDPVKASDGHTYDRWTILGYDGKTYRDRIIQSPFTKQPLQILVDDIDVRSKLFSDFAEQEEKFIKMRETYRRDALTWAKSMCDLAAAESMLNDVLQWAPEDEQCKKAKDQILEKHMPPMRAVPSMATSISDDVTNFNKLKGGEALMAEQFLVNGSYKLIMQKDDNLVVYYITGEVEIAVWNSRTFARCGARGECKLKLEENGILVIYDGRGESIWPPKVVMNEARMSRKHSEIFELVLLQDGVLEVRGSESGRLWGSRPRTWLGAGESLKAGEMIVVGENKLCMQRDDNLVLYKLEDGPKDKPIWASHTMNDAGGKGECTLLLQDNGFLAVRDKQNRMIWKNNSEFAPDDYKLILMDDGRFVIIDPKGKQMWKN